MRITLNGKERDVTDGITVAELLGELQVRGPLAVELNRQVCSKSRHAETNLQAGDVVEIVTIVGGG